MTIRTFDGTYNPESLIKRGTDPWVEVDGVPVNWQEYVKAHPTPPRADVEDGETVYCDCASSPVRGALEAMNTPEGIQRCDNCGTYEGDLDAALALAELVGGVVKYEEAE